MPEMDNRNQWIDRVLLDASTSCERKQLAIALYRLIGALQDPHKRLPPGT